MKPSIEETLVDWLGKNSLEIEKIEVEERWNADDEKVLYKASGSFRPVGIDKYEDGKKLELDYMFELERRDERFRGTKMEFISETEFKIV